MALLQNRAILVLIPFQLIAALALFATGIVAIGDDSNKYYNMFWLTRLAFPIWSGVLVFLSVVLGAYTSYASNVHPGQAFVCLLVYRAINITCSVLCLIMIFGYASMIPTPDTLLTDYKAVVISKVLFSFALVELFLSVLANVAAQYRGSPRAYTQLLDGVTSEMYMQRPLPPQVPMAQPVYQTQGPQMQPMLINQGSMQAAQPGVAGMMVPAYVSQAAGVQVSEGVLVYVPTSAAVSRVPHTLSAPLADSSEASGGSQPDNPAKAEPLVRV